MIVRSPESLASDVAADFRERFFRPLGSSTGRASIPEPHRRSHRRAPGPSLGCGPVNCTSTRMSPPLGLELVSGAGVTASLLTVVYLSRTDASKSPSETARQRVHFTKGDFLEDETRRGQKCESSCMFPKNAAAV